MYCIRIGSVRHSVESFTKPFEIDVYIALQRKFSTSKQTFMYSMLITVICCIWSWLPFCNVKHWIHGPYWKRTQTNWIPHNTYTFIHRCIYRFARETFHICRLKGHTGHAQNRTTNQTQHKAIERHQRTTERKERTVLVSSIGMNADFLLCWIK